MIYVYLIQSESHPSKTYVGITNQLKRRLAVHNSGGSVHTSNFRPWNLISYVAFSNASNARAL